MATASWETISGGDLGGDGGQALSDVVAVGSGYVAVGRSDDGVVWTSPDAVEWTAQSAVGLESAQLLHVEAAPDGTLVGVGHDLSDGQVFAAWTSMDGITWNLQPPATGADLVGVQAVSDLGSHPDGYVAVGLVNYDGESDAVWWTSPDGINWSAGTIAAPGVQQMLGVVVSDGVMVAAGEDRPNAGIWRARVGDAFEPIDHVNLTIEVSDFDPGFADARVFAWDIAAGGPGFVAVGADQTTAGSSTGAVWTSRTGRQWRRIGNETEATLEMLNADFGGTYPWTVMDTVVESEGTLIVVGRTGSAAAPDLVVWESADGFTWRRGAVGIAPGIHRATNAVAVNGELVVVGVAGALLQAPESDGAVWVVTPEPDAVPVGTWREVPQFETAPDSYAGSVTIHDGRIIAVGQSSTDPLIWESTDGITWSALPAPVPQTAQGAGFSGVTSIGRVLLVTGEDAGAAIWWTRNLSVWSKATTPEAPGVDIDGITQGQTRLIAYSSPSPGDPPAIWVSEDGRTWADTAIGDALDPDSWVAGAVEMDGQIVVAVGSLTTEETQIWLSPDGSSWTRLPGAPAFDGFWPRYTVMFGDRMVISGNAEVNGYWSNALFHSDDLETWSVVGIEARSWADYESNFGMSVVGSQLYLNVFVASTGRLPELWSTGDLTFWTQASLRPMSGSAGDLNLRFGTVQGVVRIGDRLVAVGSLEPPGGDWHATAWTNDNP